MAQAAEAVVGTLNAYGLSADQAASVTDRLLRITQLTNFQTRDFEAGLAKAAAAGSVFGQSLDDMLITMGLQTVAVVRQEMETVWELAVPLVVRIGVGESWAEAAADAKA